MFVEADPERKTHVTRGELTQVRSLGSHNSDQWFSHRTAVTQSEVRRRPISRGALVAAGTALLEVKDVVNFKHGP
jgi:hypothetical protein